MSTVVLPVGSPTEMPAEAGLFAMLRRDLALAMRSKGELAQAIAFMAVVVSFFPLAIGPEPALLKRLASGVVWVAALLSMMLTLPRLFASDYQDGTLEQLLLSPYPLAVLVGGKVAAHWLTAGVPLALLAPLAGLQFGLSPTELGWLAGSLMLGTPLLSMLGAIGAALTLGTRGGSILTALLVLPLCVPVVIFGAGAVEQGLAGSDAAAHFSLLGAAVLFGMVGAPIAAAAALRISLD